MAVDTTRLERARRFAATAAAAGCALVLAVIVASAYLRLSQAGPGWSGLAGAARIVHRLAASVEAIVAVMVVAVCWGVRRQWSGGALSALAIAALTVFLTLLGIATAEAQPPAVTLGNLLGGMALLAAFWSLRLQALAAGARDPSPAEHWIWLGIALLALQIALGGLVSAYGAAKACDSLPLCAGAWWPAGAGLPSLDSVPLAEIVRRALHMAHRYGAMLLLLYWAALALVLRRRARPAADAAVVAAMLAAQVGFGALVVVSGAAVAAAVAHNAWAALTVIAATSAAFGGGPFGRRG